MENTTSTKALNVTTNVDTMSIRLTFGDDRTLTLSTSQITPEIASHAMLHGLKQKLVDAAAISRNPDTGRSATIDDKYNAVREVYDRLLSGQWNKGRDGSGTGSGGLLFRALCILYTNKTPDAIREFLGKKSKSEQAALRATPKIADIIATLRAEPGDDADTDAMLDELEGL